MDNQQKKAGFVTLIGRPNVGKSTLMNKIIGQKIAITSNKPQTTRNRIQTVYTDERGQIVFLDTPGIHKAKNKLDRFMSSVDSCHKIFYTQVESASNIINLAAEDTPRIRDEIEGKIDAMKKIINQIEDLTNELVINIGSDGESAQEVKNLLDDMEKLIDSVEDY